VDEFDLWDEGDLSDAPRDLTIKNVHKKTPLFGKM
jgi:hypothetical protein